MVDKLIADVKNATNLNITKIHFICPATYNDEGSCPLEFYDQVFIETNQLVLYITDDNLIELKYQIYNFLTKTISDSKLLNNYFIKSSRSIDSLSEQQDSLYLKLCEVISNFEKSMEDDELYQDYQYGDKICNLHDKYCSFFHSFMERYDINKLTNHSLENGEVETAIFSLDLVNNRLTWSIEENSILNNNSEFAKNYITNFFSEKQNKIQFEAINKLLQDISL